MLIGFDGSRAFGERTGTENYSYQLLRHLAKIDHQNRYQVFLRPGAEVKASDWPANFDFVTIDYPRLWTQVGLAMATFSRPLDLLFVPAHTTPLIHRPGLKTVMTVHDLGAEFLPQMHQLKQRLYLGWITRYQFQHASRLIAVSEATKKDLMTKTKVPANRISVIYEGIDLEAFKLSSDIESSIFTQFKLTKQKYFLFVGTVQPRKNLVRLIEAFAQFNQTHPGYKLAIVGKKGWLSDEIYATPAKYDLQDQVLFLGRVDDGVLPALYAHAAALTYPSLFEGFGLPILEAYALNCPVITSSTSSMPEVAGQGALLVDPTSVEQIAQAMDQILKPATRQKLAGAAKKQLAQFSWDKTAQQTLELFERVVKK